METGSNDVPGASSQGSSNISPEVGANVGGSCHSEVDANSSADVRAKAVPVSKTTSNGCSSSKSGVNIGPNIASKPVSNGGSQRGPHVGVEGGSNVSSQARVYVGPKAVSNVISEAAPNVDPKAKADIDADGSSDSISKPKVNTEVNAGASAKVSAGASTDAEVPTSAGEVKADAEGLRGTRGGLGRQLLPQTPGLSLTVGR